MANKHKTKKSVEKRFKITKNGKVLHRSAGLRHLKSKKSQKQLRHLRKPKSLAKAFASKVKKLLGK